MTLHPESLRPPVPEIRPENRGSSGGQHPPAAPEYRQDTKGTKFRQYTKGTKCSQYTKGTKCSQYTKGTKYSQVTKGTKFSRLCLLGLSPGRGA